MEKKGYAIYLRKSREDFEAEKYGEGETLARHEKILKDLAEKKNLTIEKIYKEVVSGETISERREMQKLLKDVENEIWCGVLVVELERLARGDTMDQGIVLKAFKYSNTKIITPIKTYDPNNEFDEEYFEFGLFMSRREYKTINRRLQRGKEVSVSEGKFVGNIPPFGYNRIKLKNSKGYILIVNEEEAKVVRIIFKLYTLESDSINTIAKKLNNMNLKPRIAEKWTIASVKNILSNPVYNGKIVWNRRPQKKKSKNGQIIVTRPRNNNYLIYEGLHEEIIDDNIWNKAEEKLKLNLPKVTHSNIIKNPLAGLTFCEKCGKQMQRKPCKDYDILICSNKDCDNISSKLCIVENKIIESLKIYFESYKIDYKFQDKNLNLKVNNILDLYTELNNVEDKNIFLKSIVSKITYLKKEKAISKNSDKTNFELHIYPKI